MRGAVLAFLASTLLACAHPPRMEVVGVYEVQPDAQAYADALEVQGDEDYVRRELSSVVLVELRVRDADYRCWAGDFKQPHTDYVAYDESFLDLGSGDQLERPHLLGYSASQDRKTGRLVKWVDATKTTEPATIEEVERYRL